MTAATAVHYEHLPEVVELTRDGVAKAENVDLLYAWLGHQQRLEGELAEMVRSLGLGGVDSERISRKLGFVRISITWLLRRLTELGEDPEEIRLSRIHKKQIGALHAKVAELKLQIEEVRNERRG